MVDYKRILITGATGKIGQELARFLADYGYKILAVYRNEEKIFRWRNISWLKGDVESVDDGFRAGLNSVQVIIHLAGKLGSFDRSCLAVNWGGTKNLLRMLNKEKRIKFIFFSSIDANGTTDKREADVSDKEQPFSVYGWSKLLAEKEIVKYASTNRNFSYVILRLGNVGLENYLKNIKASKVVRALFGENEINVVSYERIKSVVKKLLEIDNYRNKIRFLVGEPMSINSLSGSVGGRGRTWELAEGLLVGLMKLTKKGGIWYYLAAGGSRKPYRRFSHKLDRELGL